MEFLCKMQIIDHNICLYVKIDLHLVRVTMSVFAIVNYNANDTWNVNSLTCVYKLE